jgi:hypothetical protein
MRSGIKTAKNEKKPRSYTISDTYSGRNSSFKLFWNKSEKDFRERYGQRKFRVRKGKIGILVECLDKGRGKISLEGNKRIASEVKTAELKN